MFAHAMQLSRCNFLHLLLFIIVVFISGHHRNECHSQIQLKKLCKKKKIFSNRRHVYCVRISIFSWQYSMQVQKKAYSRRKQKRVKRVKKKEEEIVWIHAFNPILFIAHVYYYYYLGSLGSNASSRYAHRCDCKTAAASLATTYTKSQKNCANSK